MPGAGETGAYLGAQVSFGRVSLAGRQKGRSTAAPARGAAGPSVQSRPDSPSQSPLGQRRPALAQTRLAVLFNGEKTMKFCLWPALVLGLVSCLHADGLQDNIPEKVRPIPPVGIEMPAVDQKELSEGVDALGKEIGSLQISLKTK